MSNLVCSQCGCDIPEDSDYSLIEDIATCANCEPSREGCIDWNKVYECARKRSQKVE